MPPIWYLQPFKALYITVRLSALLPLLPYWYLRNLLPAHRPRPSWTLSESIMVRLIHWVMLLNGNCNLSPLCTDKMRQVPEDELKETSFVWIEPVAVDPESSLVRGPAKDDKIKPDRIPGYVWPKGADFAAYDGLVGLFMHGGGYIMGNGTETYGELGEEHGYEHWCITHTLTIHLRPGIVRELQKSSNIKMFLSVDYRLSHEACHPGQLLDALSAYVYLVNTAKVHPSRIVIIGACAGGHLALMLARYLHEEKVLPMPIGIMLFSSWVDMVIDGQIQRGLMKGKPNDDIDLLNTSYNINLKFLGHHPEKLLFSPLLSANLAPNGSYTGYPRTFISVGGCEAWRRENQELRDLMFLDGVDVAFDVQEDAVHDFWGFGDIVPSKKARAQVAKVAMEWIRGFSTGKTG
ncbi:hypothetical protein AX15_004205 [Amanita polypyramis BW_CC]|nr:hypothetical protein AX15_004205 [Amanita polypyramis BW_CC]